MCHARGSLHVPYILLSKYRSIETRCGGGGGGCGSCPSSGSGAQNPALNRHNEGSKLDGDGLIPKHRERNESDTYAAERPSKRSKQSPGNPPSAPVALPDSRSKGLEFRTLICSKECAHFNILLVCNRSVHHHRF